MMPEVAPAGNPRSDEIIYEPTLPLRGGSIYNE